MSNQPYLGTVASRLRESILVFCGSRVSQDFHADDLRRYVSARVGACAPGSADRVLRDLRQKGALDYEVVDRAASLYHLKRVDPAFGLV